MSVTYVRGNLLDWTHWNVIAQGCNCQGVQGKGLAKAIRDRYPSSHDDYRRAYEEEGLRLGEFVVSKVEGDRRIVHLLTQWDYRRDPAEKDRHLDYEALYRSLVTLRYALEHGQHEGRGPYRLGLPHHLGCGLAGGTWAICDSIIHAIYASSTIPVYIVQLHA